MKLLHKLIFLTLALFALSINSKGQERGLIRIDTIKNCFITLSNVTYSSGYMKEIDSLLKLEQDTSVIRMRIASVEGTPLKKEYSMFYVKKGRWYFQNNNVFAKPKSILLDIHNEMKLIKSLNVSSICPNLSTPSYEFYYYLFVINGKVIKSYNGNVLATKIIDIDKKLASDLDLFKKFDTYIGLQN